MNECNSYLPCGTSLIMYCTGIVHYFYITLYSGLQIAVALSKLKHHSFGSSSSNKAIFDLLQSAFV